MSVELVVRGLVQEFIAKIGLADWTVELIFLPAWPSEIGSQEYYANCAADADYRTATITFVLPGLPTNPVELEKLVLHELCHAIIWDQTAALDILTEEGSPLRAFTDAACERTATKLETLLYKLLRP